MLQKVKTNKMLSKRRPRQFVDHGIRYEEQLSPPDFRSVPADVNPALYLMLVDANHPVESQRVELDDLALIYLAQLLEDALRAAVEIQYLSDDRSYRVLTRANERGRNAAATEANKLLGRTFQSGSNEYLILSGIVYPI